MTERIRLVQGDTRPAIICTLTDSVTKSPLALAGATVRLKFREAGATALTATITGSITDVANAVVAFFPASSPEMLSGEPGNYEGEIEITFEDGTVQTVFDLLKFKVREDF